jgi:pimeloyl-ACP methyl ester carboxylesterase
MQPLSLLLPGLDGTGELFERFVAAASRDWPVRIVPLPSDRPRGYHDLAECLLPALPTERFALIAESFSGPLAILLANRCPQIYAVVLAASFARAPIPRAFARLAGLAGRLQPPAWALRVFMTGGDPVLTESVRRVLPAAGRDVIGGRIAAVSSVDVTSELQRVRQPLLVLRGARDRLIHARAAETIRALKPAATLVDLDGAHLLLQTTPNECWAAIQPFLRGTAAL